MKNLLTQLFLILIVLSSCKKDEDDNITYNTNFNNNDGWYLGDTVQYSCKIKDGKYEMAVNVPSCYVYSIEPSVDITYDYSVSVDCSIILDDNNKNGIVGIHYNYNDEGFGNAFVITKQGYIVVIKNEGLKSMTLLSSSVDKSVLGPSGEINHLEVIQRSTSTEFKVNHITVGTLSYGRTYPKVKAGLMVNSANESNFTKIKAVFDNFTIRKL